MRKLSTLILASFLFMPLAYAGPGFGGKGGGLGRLHKLSEELGLTDEQKQKLKDIRQQETEASKAKREVLKTARKALGDALTAQDSTPAQLTALNEKLAQAKLDVMRAQFSKLLEMRAVLTPEQLSKLPKFSPLGKGSRGDRGFDLEGL